METQTKRLRRALWTGTIAAFVLGTLFPLFLMITEGAGHDPQAFITIAGFGAAGAICAALCISLIYSPAMRRRESRKRGFWFGVLTGFIAFVLMIICLFIFTLMQEYLAVKAGGRPVPDGYKFGLGFFLIAGFIFGGFLSLPACLPAGGWLGWAFSRNPDKAGGGT